MFKQREMTTLEFFARRSQWLSNNIEMVNHRIALIRAELAQVRAARAAIADMAPRR